MSSRHWRRTRPGAGDRDRDQGGGEVVGEVAVDADERPDLDKLEELSQAVSEEFDARETSGTLNFGPGYTFEVTTPGVDTPLTQPRHFRRNIGRLVTFAVSGNGGSKDTLRIAAVDEQPAGPAGSAEPTVWMIRPGEKKKDARPSSRTDWRRWLVLW